MEVFSLVRARHGAAREHFAGEHEAALLEGDFAVGLRSVRSTGLRGDFATGARTLSALSATGDFAIGFRGRVVETLATGSFATGARARDSASRRHGTRRAITVTAGRESDRPLGSESGG